MKLSKMIKALHQASKQVNNTQEKKNHLENFVVDFYIFMELRVREYCFLIAALKSWVSKEEESTISSIYWKVSVLFAEEPRTNTSGEVLTKLVGR